MYSILRLAIYQVAQREDGKSSVACFLEAASVECSLHDCLWKVDNPSKSGPITIRERSGVPLAAMTVLACRKRSSTAEGYPLGFPEPMGNC